MSPFEDQLSTAIAARDFFEEGKPVWVARAPGRLDVMGGNVDYTGGMVLQSLLREAVCVTVQPRSDDLIRILNPGAEQFGWECSLELRVADLRDLRSLQLLCGRAQSLRWTGYVLGALHFLESRWGAAGGADLFVSSDLPPNKGVSSSAALEIAVLKAASAARGIALDGVELATAGQWVENVVVGAACGIMDQAAIVLGEKYSLLPLLCQSCQPLPLVSLPLGLALWGIDSMAPRSTTGATYEAARAAAFIGYKLICQREGIEILPDRHSPIPRNTDARWNGYLSNLSPCDFRSRYERWLPESLSGREFLERTDAHADPFTSIHPNTDYRVRAATRYATEENLRVQLVRALLESHASGMPDSSLRRIGELFQQSHAAYAECGLGSDGCDELVELALHSGLPAAKMTGGGAGGVVAILGRSQDQPVLQRVAQQYAAAKGAVPHVFEGSSDGVDAFAVRSLQFPSRQDAS